MKDKPLGMFKFLIIIFAFTFSFCSNKKEKKVNQQDWSHHDLKTQQYLIEGKRLYNLHCANCHMEDGKGLGKLIPPLSGSDYMLSDVNRTICIIKQGMSGEIRVNNEVYNHPMPENTILTNIEIAEITTFLYNSWGSDKGIVSIPEVKKALESCKE